MKVECVIKNGREMKMAHSNVSETVRRAVENNGHVPTFGIPSQQQQQIDAEYARQKDARTKR